MKRRDLLKRIEREGAVFIREGSNHTVYRNPYTGKTIVIPRHREVDEELAEDMIRVARRRQG